MKYEKFIDRQMKAEGFNLIEESDDIVVYERQQPEFVQVLELGYRENGQHNILSYQKGVNADGHYNAVGLTLLEVRLAIRKIFEKEW